MQRTITWIAAAIGAVILVALPGAYFQFARAHIDATLTAEVEINARLVTQIINGNPELWRFQTTRLLTLLENRPADRTRETRRVFDGDGTLIAESVDDLAPPLAVRASTVHDSGRAAGRLEIARSLRPALWEAAAVAGAALVLAALVFFVLRVLPLRALKSALEDLVAQREAAQQMQRERDTAAAAARVRSEFLARMSHEIRTPMNGVLGMAELLLQTDLDTKQRRCAETVMASGQSLLAIIDDILDFSRIDAGKLALERLEFDPAEIVEDVTQMLAAIAWRKGLQFDGVIEPGVPSRMVGDPARLRQVLTNLAGNAVKFTASGAVLLTARATAAPDPMLELRVSDTGIGIAQPALARLFDPFAQADTTTRRRFGGTGLGLAISRQLVEAMGGSITVDSVIGRGSTFSVLLPVAPGITPPAPPDAAASLRALVVEPAPGARAALVAALARLGVATDTAGAAADGCAILEAARRQDTGYDLVFAAAEAAPQLQAILDAPGDAPAARTLIVLAPIGADAGAVARRLGAAHVLVKPIRAADVRALLTGAAAPSAPPRAAPEKITAGRALRVLLVEDNAVNQMVAAAMLTQLAVELTTAANGREAIEAVRRTPFDLVLMDCQMPEMDGFEAARAIRRQEQAAALHADGPRRLAIIALTANAMVGDRDRCLDAGMDDYLSKPYSIGQLRAALQRWTPQQTAH